MCCPSQSSRWVILCHCGVLTVSGGLWWSAGPPEKKTSLLLRHACPWERRRSGVSPQATMAALRSMKEMADTRRAALIPGASMRRILLLGGDPPGALGPVLEDTLAMRGMAVKIVIASALLEGG
ncbi:hypothetical protein NDU88_007427 [Pleurodeles waltl]|uniref:Uncharacterized protein n=1 Tax=Pleurodeles waltl TaxID=8319 RepID=A0AAV7NT25_PLEWA|nr:hypothetical protein NDU88_007427 [Pleurodeles waltl]